MLKVVNVIFENFPDFTLIVKTMEEKKIFSKIKNVVIFSDMDKLYLNEVSTIVVYGKFLQFELNRIYDFFPESKLILIR